MGETLCTSSKTGTSEEEGRRTAKHLLRAGTQEHAAHEPLKGAVMIEEVPLTGLFFFSHLTIIASQFIQNPTTMSDRLFTCSVECDSHNSPAHRSAHFDKRGGEVGPEAPARHVATRQGTTVKDTCRLPRVHTPH